MNKLILYRYRSLEASYVSKNPIFQSHALKLMKETPFLHEISGNFGNYQLQLLLIDP